MLLSPKGISWFSTQQGQTQTPKGGQWRLFSSGPEVCVPTTEGIIPQHPDSLHLSVDIFLLSVSLFPLFLPISSFLLQYPELFILLFATLSLL